MDACGPPVAAYQEPLGLGLGWPEPEPKRCVGTAGKCVTTGLWLLYSSSDSSEGQASTWLLLAGFQQVLVGKAGPCCSESEDKPGPALTPWSCVQPCQQASC